MTPSDSPNRSTAELVRHYIDQAWNRGHFAVIPEVTAEPYQAGAWNSPRRPFRSLTLKELEGQVADFRSAFPDLVMHVEDILEQGERAYVRTRMTGTQRGAFMGMPATGKAVDVTLCAVYESRGGKLIGHGALVDMMGLMQQLGVAPGPPTAGAPPPAGSSPP